MLLSTYITCVRIEYRIESFVLVFMTWLHDLSSYPWCGLHAETMAARQDMNGNK